MDELLACESCAGEGCAALQSGPPALLSAVERLRQSARALRRSQSKLRQREAELSEAVAASARYEERIENMSRVYKQSTRELEPQIAVVERQAETIRALSAPILEVGDGVVAIPIIGSLNEERARHITTALLERIHERRTRFAILDLTGLEEVDASTAAILVRVCGALRMLGAQAILCGLACQVAMQLVKHQADLSAMWTLPNLRAALQRCR